MANPEPSHSNKSFQYLTLNLKETYTPFNLPGIEELSAALLEVLPDQQGMILSALRGRGQGIYKIQLTQPINNIGALKVTLGEGIEVPVTEFIPHLIQQITGRQVRWSPLCRRQWVRTST